MSIKQIEKQNILQQIPRKLQAVFLLTPILIRCNPRTAAAPLTNGSTYPVLFLAFDSVSVSRVAAASVLKRYPCFL